MSTTVVLQAIAIGIAATVLIDLWSLALKRLFAVPSLDICLLGRWVLHMPHGRFRHISIARAEKQSMECVVGWTAHYAIGVSFALIFLVLESPDWVAQPTFLTAIGFGAITVVFPWFTLQPAFGLGLASAKTAHSARARLKSVTTHAVFGMGLYLAAFFLF